MAKAATSNVGPTSFTYPPAESFDYQKPVIPGPASPLQCKLWAAIESDVDALTAEAFDLEVEAAGKSSRIEYERMLLGHARRSVRRSGLVLFRVRRDGADLLAKWRAELEEKIAERERIAAAERDRTAAAEQRAAEFRADLIGRKLAKEVGPSRKLVVVRPSSASSLPPLPPGNDRLRKPAASLRASVECERRAFVRAMHASGYENLPKVLATNLGTDGTVADALKPLKAKSASVFDVQFALRAMAYVRAYFRDQGVDLTSESAAA